MRTVRLEDHWSHYYERGFKPVNRSDEIRVALLHGGQVGPATSKEDGSRLSVETSTLTKLGYRIDRVDVDRGDGVLRTAYRIANLDHRPTPEDFARARARAGIVSTAATNGNGSAHGNALSIARGMLPELGDRLVASVVGFDEDGAPYLVLTGPDGWRYTCRVTESRAPRTSDE